MIYIRRTILTNTNLGKKNRKKLFIPLRTVTGF